MMATNRYRLKAAAGRGERGARLVLELLGQTDRLLGVVLLFNTLINAATATLAGYLSGELFGEEKWVLGTATLLVSFLILVFAEITPKVIGANYPDTLAPFSAYILRPLLRLVSPVIWFVNLFVNAMLGALRLKRAQGHDHTSLSLEELRALVLESGNFIPRKHHSILLNLFDLEGITVEDAMTPRGSIEAIDLAAPLEAIREQLATSYHTRLLVYEDEPGNVLGIVHLRRLMGAALAGDLDRERLRAELSKPYFIPASTPIYTQLQYFQEKQERMALVVDEYGDLLGLITLEDIIEEMIGKFTSSHPGGNRALRWDAQGTVVVDGTRPLRELNRALDLNLPLDGPKTLNGLILEHFEDIPDGGVSLRIAGVHVEVVHTEDRKVKTVRLFRPDA